MNLNKSNARQITAFLTAGAALCSLFGLAGCSSGGGTTTAFPVPSPSATPIAGSVISRATENTLTDDAKVLATRQATGAFVSLDQARAFDADLAKIRAAYPGVGEVHARLAYEPKSLLVIVKSTAPWFDKWQTSASAPATTTDTDLTTGEATLDALLQKYDATRTTTYSPTGNEQRFVLRFAAALNMTPVASEFAQSSPNVTAADSNIYAGDGDNIVYSVNSANEKVYAFSQGYGDCPAGCINRYTRTYTLHTDGTITEQIEGTQPPNDADLVTTR